MLVHGFTQNAGCWGPLVGALGRQRPLLAVDLPGHGASSGLSADLWGTADLLAATTTGPADHLGYSLGGRVALHLALARPAAVRRLVLVGATAGIVDPTARAARRRADEALADRIAAGALPAFLDQWLAQPLFRTLSADAAGRSARLANTAAGLADSLRRAGTGTQAPLWDHLGALQVPVLLVAGALDVRFATTAAAMARAIGPNAQLSLVAGAGHACHLEQPRLVARLVEAFLA